MRVRQSKFKKTNPKTHSGWGRVEGRGWLWAPGARDMDPFCSMTGVRPTQVEI